MIHVTRHAIDRYRERVADIPDDAIIAVLSTPTFEAAINFGAPCVILGTGHKAVIKDRTVVTVNPKRGV